jgi:hypothetical protein
MHLLANMQKARTGVKALMQSAGTKVHSLLACMHEARPESFFKNGCRASTDKAGWSKATFASAIS